MVEHPYGLSSSFALFDIWKPYPIRRLEALESGLGIMADDVLAGIYALDRELASDIGLPDSVFRGG